MMLLVSSQPLIVAFTLIRIFPLTSSVQPTWSCYQETGSCYYLPDVPRTQGEASCWCRSAGGHLVKIDSQEELRLVRQLIGSKNQSKGFYIGATDRRIEGRFIWEDGTYAGDIIPWRKGEQDNDGGEHCVLLNDHIWWNTIPDPLPDYLAFDITCLKEHLFVCEKGNLRARIWERRSSDETYPSENHQSYPGLLALQCADRCARACLCSSFAHGPGQDGGECIIYYKPYSRLRGPQVSPGHVIYE